MLPKCLALKARLRAGETTLGAWLTFSDAAVAEIMADLGYDWLLIDAEHAPFSLDSLAHLLTAFHGRQAVPLIRVRWNDPPLIKQVLDLGAGGILIPYVCTPDEAWRAVAACKYPPEGIRGFGPRRAADYGRQMAAYIQQANDAILVGIQIEHISGVKAIRDILAVPGLDFLMLGPMDLSASLGLLGQLEHPKVVEAMEMVINEANRRRLPVGMPLPADTSLDTVTRWVEKGCRFVLAGLDQSFLTQAAQDNLAQLRQRLHATTPSQV